MVLVAVFVATVEEQVVESEKPDFVEIELPDLGEIRLNLGSVGKFVL